MGTLKHYFRLLTSREYRTSMKVSDFMQRNPDLLVIVCDPKTDTIMTGYRRFASATRIDPDLKNHKTRSKVISSVLSMSRVDKSIDRFLLQVDGAVWGIAKAIRDKRKESRLDQVVTSEDEELLKAVGASFTTSTSTGKPIATA